MQKLGDYFYKTIRSASVVALAGLVGLGAGLVPASAQGRYDRPGYGGYRNLSRSDVQRIAAVNGYSDGFERGVVERRTRRSLGYRDTSEYRRALNGYDSRWGYARDYQSRYRQAYERGYRDGFYGRSRNRDYDRGRLPDYDWGRDDWRYGDRRGDLDRDDVARRAAQNGYSAGFQWGQRDAARRNRPVPQGHGAYRYALDGFDPEWGHSSTYQQYYRTYFVRGYNDGYSRRSYNYRY